MQPTPPRILVADNDPAGRANLRRQLQYAGYEVSFAECGSDVIWDCYDSPPDVLILDVDLPDMDGFEVCEYLRHTTGGSETTVIFLSAANDEMTRTYLGRMVEYADGDFFFAKPYDARLVARVVEEVLSGTADAPERPRIVFPTRVIWPTSHCCVSTGGQRAGQ